MPQHASSSVDGLSVYGDDTTLFDLNTAELFLVTVVRLWAAGRSDPVQPVDWPSAFRVAATRPEAVPAFDALMGVIADGAREPIDIRPRPCCWLGRDEGRLLRLISLLQRDRVVEASALLPAWLLPAAARLALRHASILAAALAGVGLVVPLRHAQAAALSLLAACAHATPGLALLQ
jgi:hypothetical protein